LLTVSRNPYYASGSRGQKPESNTIKIIAPGASRPRELDKINLLINSTREKFSIQREFYVSLKHQIKKGDRLI